MNDRPATVLAMMPHLPPRLFAAPDMAQLRSVVRLDPNRILTCFEDAGDLAEVRFLITGWGAPLIDAAALDRMPRLTHVFHTAGTVKAFADPVLWERGITVTSAAQANAIPVAEYTLAMILLAGKRIMQSAQIYRDSGELSYSGGDSYAALDTSRVGNYRQVVGVISASSVGRLVLDHLARFDFRVLLYDPFVTDAEAAELGATKVDLPELFATSDVITLHAPDLPATRGMVSRPLLESMQEGATFINTARPAIVDQDALVDALRDGRRRAVLDVSTPEPLPPGHELWTLPNVLITPHWAGSQGNELWRMGRMALDALIDTLAGRMPRGLVTRRMLETMA